MHRPIIAEEDERVGGRTGGNEFPDADVHFENEARDRGAYGQAFQRHFGRLHAGERRLDLGTGGFQPGACRADREAASHQPILADDDPGLQFFGALQLVFLIGQIGCRRGDPRLCRRDGALRDHEFGFRQPGIE